MDGAQSGRRTGAAERAERDEHVYRSQRNHAEKQLHYCTVSGSADREGEERNVLSIRPQSGEVPERNVQKRIGDVDGSVDRIRKPPERVVFSCMVLRERE